MTMKSGFKNVISTSGKLHDVAIGATEKGTIDRKAIILRGIDKAQRGIEIAPWFTPLAPKREGYNCLSLDVFDKETLITRGLADKEIGEARVPDIEPVDLLGSATEIADIIGAKNTLGSFDYIVSSHNFEHLANPIRFLQGCAKVLKPGGILSMAIPDHRACFDFFRPVTMLPDWLEAYYAERVKPTAAQVFAQSAYNASLRLNGNEVGAFSLNDDPKQILLEGKLDTSYDFYNSHRCDGTDDYIDAHCTVMTPSSFQLLTMECLRLGLITLRTDYVSVPNGCEFYVTLRNETETQSSFLDEREFQASRERLLHQIADENAMATRWGRANSIELSPADVALLDALNLIRKVTRRITSLPKRARKALKGRISRRMPDNTQG